MAIATNGSSAVSSQTNGLAVLTISSFTISAGTDLCLVVAGGVDASADRNPTATWNGVSMTLVGEIIGGASAQPTALFRLLNPATGTHNVVVSSDLANANDHITGIVQCYSGVDQTTPFSNTTTRSSGASTSSALTVTSAGGDLVIDTANLNSQTSVNDFAAGGSQTTVGEVVSDGTANGTGQGMSSQAGSASVSMSWTFISASRVGHVASSMKASATGSAGNLPFWQIGYDGVGGGRHGGHRIH